MSSGSTATQNPDRISASMSDGVNLLSNSSNYSKVEEIATTNSASAPSERKVLKVETRSGPFIARKIAKGELSPLTAQGGTPPVTIEAKLVPKVERTPSVKNSTGVISASGQPTEFNKGVDVAKGVKAGGLSVQTLTVSPLSSTRQPTPSPASRQPGTPSIVTLNPGHKQDLPKSLPTQPSVEEFQSKSIGARLDTVPEGHSDESIRDGKQGGPPSALHDPSSNSSPL